MYLSKVQAKVTLLKLFSHFTTSIYLIITNQSWHLDRTLTYTLWFSYKLHIYKCLLVIAWQCMILKEKYKEITKLRFSSTHWHIHPGSNATHSIKPIGTPSNLSIVQFWFISGSLQILSFLPKVGYQIKQHISKL